MADPRFFDNRGPFRLAELCAKAGVDCPDGAGDACVFDVAGLGQAGPMHLSFFEGGRARDEFQSTKAGWCLVKATPNVGSLPASTVLISALSVARAFAAIASAFYPEHEHLLTQNDAVHPTAQIGEGVQLGHGVVVGAGAGIGEKTRIGAGSVISRGVTIGRGCLIGARVSVQCAHIGDEVVIQAGAVIGASGFGFASLADGHVKIPQLGRVIIQDRVEIGANSAIDRGALGDTLIGEGTKIDNLVQIGHNTRVGRHCVMAGQVGISGSVKLGDFVLLGGKVGVADHVIIGDRVRVAALSGVGTDLEAGADYGGIPARPLMQWKREIAALAKMAKTRKRAAMEDE
jgi:UDP-3-O-[3-hydroxymyristoyl] glucosamine N-acyltransferase